jgi:hypothetical protein
MRELPLKKIGGFGGKLGSELETMGCATAGDIWHLPLEMLSGRLGSERAAWVVRASCGRCSVPVEEKGAPKSMLAAKSFIATSDAAALRRWMGVLAQELAADEAEWQRRPRLLALHFRGPRGERSRSCPMPRRLTKQQRQQSASAVTEAGGDDAGTDASHDAHNAGAGGGDAAALAAAAWHLFKTRCWEDAVPCTRLAMSAADFVDLPGGGSAGSGGILRFLVTKSAGDGVQGHQQQDEERGKTAGTGPEQPAVVSAGPRKRRADVAALLVQASKRQRPNTSADAGPGWAGIVAEAGRLAVPLPPEDNEGVEKALPPKENQEKDDPLLACVNIAEQRRILKELEFLRATRRGRPLLRPQPQSGRQGQGRGAAAAGGGQRSISSFLSGRPPQQQQQQPQR